jgi:hypothetical protein
MAGLIGNLDLVGWLGALIRRPLPVYSPFRSPRASPASINVAITADALPATEAASSAELGQRN